MLLGGFCDSVVTAEMGVGPQSLWRNMGLQAGGGREGHCNQDVGVSGPIHQKMCSLCNKPVKKGNLSINVWYLVYLEKLIIYINLTDF